MKKIHHGAPASGKKKQFLKIIVREKFHNYGSVSLFFYPIYCFWFEEKWFRLEFSQPEAVEHQLYDNFIVRLLFSFI